MTATELHARLGGTLHRLSAASWALHVARWRPSTPQRFDAEWDLHPAERRELVVFNRRCFENRYSWAFGDVSYAYAGQVAQASPIEATCGELLTACNAALGDSELNSCLQNWYEPDHWLCDHRDNEKALVQSAPIASVSWGAARRFTLKPRKKVPASIEADAADSVPLELYLGDGDLCIMGGTCQQTHTHGVPKRRKKDLHEPGRRISWTFREFKAPGEADRKRKR